ncbi:hypothetical protein MIND_00627200 [Mycena indigotica]|uniref:cAMP-independent regulatory protein pac2 n=1 Tax=Mycena indigotica TaxID=2126181 RepID=A0A8H6SRA4_9AGAR|nr:uncharacterized protein MIND_00627200 [Mycena indigotica]KAF7303964.1 hypothetical protein MIND_00627200 [Mycena indigotica]
MNTTSYQNCCITHPALHIRDINDAHRVLQAVRLNILPLVKRRLSPSERMGLQSGNVFVWEESDTDDGLVRWTEGKRWSQSRMRGDCLIYEEKIDTTEDERREKATRRAFKCFESPEQMVPPPPKRKDRPSKVDGLTKHAYSVTVKLPNHTTTRKWHLVAYFSARESALLPVVEDYPYLRAIEIPRGVFGGHNGRSYGGCIDLFPRPIEPPDAFAHHTISPSQPRENYGPPLALQSPPTQLSSTTANTLPPISPNVYSVPLPPLSSLGHFFPKAPDHYVASAALSQDDRRVLEKFRVIL